MRLLDEGVILCVSKMWKSCNWDQIGSAWKFNVLCLNKVLMSVILGVVATSIICSAFCRHPDIFRRQTLCNICKDTRVQQQEPDSGSPVLYKV